MAGIGINQGVSLTIQRYLGRATSSIGTNFLRLSSGSRINRASDDAASLAIADRLRANSRILTVATGNINDGVSALNIANSALEQQSGIVLQMTELAEQAANGSLSAVQRSTLDKEYITLMREYKRVSQGTEFNRQRLLLGLRPLENGLTALQAGITGSSTGVISFINPDTGEYSGYIDTDTLEHVTDSGLAWNDFVGSNHTLEEILARFPNTSFIRKAGVNGETTTDVMVIFGIDTGTIATGAIGISVFRLNTTSGDYVPQDSGYLLSLSSTDPTRIDSSLIGEIYTTFGVELSALRFVSSSQTGRAASVLEYSGIESASRARLALSVLSARRDAIALERGKLGAIESRLQAAGGVVAASLENTSTAESRIRDVDVANEASELLRYQILQQSAAAALGHLNEDRALILKLLG